MSNHNPKQRVKLGEKYERRRVNGGMVVITVGLVGVIAMGIGIVIGGLFF